LAGGASLSAFGHGQAGATTITVTAGKPRENSFTLSKTSVLKGVITFKIVNRGKVAHSFTIVGKKTPPIAPGKSAILTVVIIDAGTYPYSSSVKGQSAMKGALHVTEPPSPTTAAATTIPAGAGEPIAKPADAPCASPATTTVSVTIIDFGFNLSQTTIPCGTVTFNVTNSGQAAHTFDIEATTANGTKAFQGGTTLLGGEKKTQTVTFSRTGTFQYRCDIHYADFGMGGSVAVT